MKYLLTAGLFLASLIISAQGNTCTITSPSDSFCSKCNSGGSSDIMSGGQLNGTLIIDFDDPTESWTLPLGCECIGLFLGDLSIIVEDGSTLIMTNPDINPAAVDLTISPNTDPASGIIIYEGTTYTVSSEMTSFADLQLIIQQEAEALANVLPVILQSYTVNSSGKDVLIEWTTAAEINNELFLLEHSNDGLDFRPLASVRATAGNSSTEEYAFRHEQPAGEMHFYRLIQQDYDGSRMDFGTRSIVIVNNELTAYPNPVTSGESVTINVPEGVTELTLYGINGVLLGKYATGGRTRSIPLPARPGNYILIAGNDALRLVVK